MCKQEGAYQIILPSVDEEGQIEVVKESPLKYRKAVERFAPGAGQRRKRQVKEDDRMEMENDRFPIMLGFRTKSAETCAVWCPYCSSWHWHEAWDGLRKAGCPKETPFSGGKYIVKLVNLPVEIQRKVANRQPMNTSLKNRGYGAEKTQKRIALKQMEQLRQEQTTT